MLNHLHAHGARAPAVQAVVAVVPLREEPRRVCTALSYTPGPAPQPVDGARDETIPAQRPPACGRIDYAGQVGQAFSCPAAFERALPIGNKKPAQPLQGEALPEVSVVMLGAAYAGEAQVKRVEVSIDMGGTWAGRFHNGVCEHAVKVVVA